MPSIATAHESSTDGSSPTSSPGVCRRLAFSLSAGVMVLGLAACGAAASTATGDPNQVASLSGSGDTGTTVKANDNRTPEQRAMDFSKCMRDNGVTNFPDPKLDANGQVQRGFDDNTGIDGTTQTFKDAMAACRSLRGGGGGFLNDPATRQKFQDAALKYAACMREQGLNVKDPDFTQARGPGGGGGQPPAAVGQPPAGGDRGPGGGGFANRILRGVGLDPNDPKVIAANTTCQPVFQKALDDSGVKLPGQGG